MKRFFRWATPLLILSVLLMPPLSALLPVGLGMRGADIIVLLFVAFAAVGNRSTRAAVTWGTPQRLLLLFSFSAAISLLVGSLIGESSGLRDVVPIARFLVAVAFLTLVRSAISADHSTIDRIYRWLAIGSVVLAVIVMQQHWDWLGLNELYLNRVAASQSSALGLYGDRPVGMAGNPNVLGFMSAMLALSMLHMVARKQRYIYFVPFALQLYCLFLSGSRSAVLAFAVASLAYSFASLWTARNRAAGSPLAAVTALLVVVVFGVALSSSVTLVDTTQGQRFAELRDISDSGSYVDHSEKLSASLPSVIQNPLFGTGFHTNTSVSSVDSDWGTLLLSFGILGTALFALAFVSIVFSRRAAEPRTLGIVALMAAAVYMVTSAITTSAELTYLLIIVLSVSVVPTGVRLSPADGVVAGWGGREPTFRHEGRPAVGRHL